MIMDNIYRTDMFIYEEENNRPVRDRKTFRKLIINSYFIICVLLWIN